MEKKVSQAAAQALAALDGELHAVQVMVAQAVERLAKALAAADARLKEGIPGDQKAQLFILFGREGVEEHVAMPLMHARIAFAAMLDSEALAGDLPWSQAPGLKQAREVFSGPSD